MGGGVGEGVDACPASTPAQLHTSELLPGFPDLLMQDL